MPDLETIKVVNPDGEGFMIINKEDFDSKVYTRWEQRPKPQQTKAKTKKASKPTGNSAAPEVAEDDPEDDSNPLLDRIQELEDTYAKEGWRSISELAEKLGIEKPSEGWKLAIPLIAQKEIEGGSD